MSVELSPITPISEHNLRQFTDREPLVLVACVPRNSNSLVPRSRVFRRASLACRPVPPDNPRYAAPRLRPCTQSICRRTPLLIDDARALDEGHTNARSPHTYGSRNEIARIPTREPTSSESSCPWTSQRASSVPGVTPKLPPQPREPPRRPRAFGTSLGSGRPCRRRAHRAPGPPRHWQRQPVPADQRG